MFFLNLSLWTLHVYFAHGHIRVYGDVTVCQGSKLSVKNRCVCCWVRRSVVPFPTSLDEWMVCARYSDYGSVPISKKKKWSEELEKIVATSCMGEAFKEQGRDVWLAHLPPYPLLTFNPSSPVYRSNKPRKSPVLVSLGQMVYFGALRDLLPSPLRKWSRTECRDTTAYVVPQFPWLDIDTIWWEQRILE